VAPPLGGSATSCGRDDKRHKIRKALATGVRRHPRTWPDPYHLMLIAEPGSEAVLLDQLADLAPLSELRWSPGRDLEGYNHVGSENSLSAGFYRFTHGI